MAADGLEKLAETGATVVGTGVGIGGGYIFVRWFLEWLGGRVDKREAAVSIAMAQVDAGTRTLISDLQSQIDWFKGQLVEVRRDLEHCQTEHNAAKGEIAQLRGLMQGLGDARQTAQLIVSAEVTTKKEEDGNGTA